MKKISSPTICEFKDLGLIDYERAWDLQTRKVTEVIAGAADSIFLCEHPPVLTMGRLAAENNILWPNHELAQKGVEVHKIDRGGEVTLHCPGQLVVYPILNLERFGKDLKLYLEKLQQVAIDLLQDFDIVATGLSGQRGVWAGERKIVSIGIGVKKWVTYHGLVVNVNSDLTLFDMIKSCGLDVRMTSIEQEKGRAVDMRDVKEKITRRFCEQFQLEIS